MSVYAQLSERLRSEEFVCLATLAAGEEMGRQLLVTAGDAAEVLAGDLGSSARQEAVLEMARRAETTEDTTLAPAADVEVFFEAFPPPPKLIVVGAVHVAIHLVPIAQRLGFRTVVVDARAQFATEERFATADELIVRWPGDALAEMPLHDSTYCVFLTHDPKLDEPAIQVALEAGVRYVGALGSSRTHAKRVASLLERGVAQELIDTICAPIGLPLGGRRPEEIAVSIAAELVQARYGRLPEGRGKSAS